MAEWVEGVTEGVLHWLDGVVTFTQVDVVVPVPLRLLQQLFQETQVCLQEAGTTPDGGKTFPCQHHVVQPLFQRQQLTEHKLLSLEKQEMVEVFMWAIFILQKQCHFDGRLYSFLPFKGAGLILRWCAQSIRYWHYYWLHFFPFLLCLALTEKIFLLLPPCQVQHLEDSDTTTTHCVLSALTWEIVTWIKVL